jgi:hypothetical protein
VAEEYISGRRQVNADATARNRARVAKYLVEWIKRPVDTLDEPDVYAGLNRMEAEGPRHPAGVRADGRDFPVRHPPGLRRGVPDF